MNIGDQSQTGSPSLAYSLPKDCYVNVENVNVHYQKVGDKKPVMLFLHGFGANTFTWRKVLHHFEDLGTAIAYDRPGFGLTERVDPRGWEGKNPYHPDTQPDIAIGLLDALGSERAILIGHSAGGTIALVTAFKYPARVQGLVLVDAAIYTSGGTPTWARPIVRLLKHIPLGTTLTKPLTRFGNRIMGYAWHDPSKLTADVVKGYSKSWQVPGWEKGFWEMVINTGPSDYSWLPKRVKTPAMVITGDDDRIVPLRESIRLAHELPNAELVKIVNCGHIPQEECPDAFMSALKGFINRIHTTKA